LFFRFSLLSSTSRRYGINCFRYPMFQYSIMVFRRRFCSVYCVRYRVRCLGHRSVQFLSSFAEVHCLWALLLRFIMRRLRYGRVRGVVMEVPVPPPASVSPLRRAGPPQGGTDPRHRRPGRVDLPGRRRKPPGTPQPNPGNTPKCSLNIRIRSRLGARPIEASPS